MKEWKNGTPTSRLRIRHCEEYAIVARRFSSGDTILNSSHDMISMASPNRLLALSITAREIFAEVEFSRYGILLCGKRIAVDPVAFGLPRR